MMDFASVRHLPVVAAAQGIQAREWQLRAGDLLDCGPDVGVLRGGELRAALEVYTHRSGGDYRPQLAALVFFATGQPRALDGYFPLTGALNATQIDDFHLLTANIAQHSNFDLRLLDERGNTVDISADAAFLAAGQIAEIFFFRQDILERLLRSPRRIWLYTTPRAFAAGGGVAGGCYNGTHGCVQLLLARLYEGFYTPAPGVAPFLHEFGHMLDHFDAGRCEQGASAGLLPGMRAGDGAIFTPAARELFLRGKRLELERYLRLYDGAPADAAALPIGHPYVFQNDTEFIAGYVEMFFRNPHAFARQNPDLYAGFATLLRQDPRRAWEADFPFYVEENRRFYLGGGRPSQPGLTFPTE
jgi:hypothetical protein